MFWIGSTREDALTGNGTRRRAMIGAMIAMTVGLAFAVPSSAYAWNSDGLQLFATPGAAQRHCPADTVVWLNTNSGIYHLKGERWYGRTEHGAYVCEHAADRAGDRETRNGQ